MSEPDAPPGWTLSRADLDPVLEATGSLWDVARGERILFTGASGFIGAWLVESWLWANARLGLGMQATVVARDPQRLFAARPHWREHAALQVHAADVTRDALPAGPFALVVHGAAETNVRLDAPSAESMLMTSITGTQRVLESTAAQARFLFLSSGAAYGPQPPEVERLAESARLAPDCTDIRQAYGHGKRAAEVLLNCATAAGRVQAVSARCFAFSGPHLPLDSGFAIGNFVRDVLRGEPIVIKGDGTPLRSYLYGADMATWLWHMLLRGRAGAIYNVGSADAVSIAELAQRVRLAAGGPASPAPQVLGQAQPGASRNRYVPDVSLARTELGLLPTVGLDDGIARMAAWYRSRQRLSS